MSFGALRICALILPFPARISRSFLYLQAAEKVGEMSRVFWPATREEMDAQDEDVIDTEKDAQQRMLEGEIRTSKTASKSTSKKSKYVAEEAGNEGSLSGATASASHAESLISISSNARVSSGTSGCGGDDCEVTCGATEERPSRDECLTASPLILLSSSGKSGR